MAGLADRFWSKVDKRGPKECWPWHGCLVGGRGQMLLRIAGQKKHIYAPRIALELSGIDLRGKFALHRCNNPRCVNPSHLYAGSRSDNTFDAMNAGTCGLRKVERGDANLNAKLRESQIPAIRALSSSLSMQRIADDYGVSRKTISKVLSGQTWGHV